MAIISLRDVVDAMETSTDDTVSYLDPDTAEIIAITEDERRWAEGESGTDVPEWARAMLPKVRAALEDDRLLQLPGRFEIDEWSSMEEFSRSQSNQRVRQRLLNAIHGAGALQGMDSIHDLSFPDIPDWSDKRLCLECVFVQKMAS